MRFLPIGFPLRLARGFLLPLLFSLAIFPVSRSSMASAQAITIGPVLTAVVGNRIQGYSGDGGPAASAEVYFPGGIVFDPAGNLYFADYDNYVVRKVDTAGIITTVAGNGTLRYSGDGGPATSAGMDPIWVTRDNAGNLYIADYRNNRIRKVAAATGIVTTIAGTGVPGFGGDGGPATQAELHWPQGVALDSAGNLYIVDSVNERIRKVSATTGIITTVAGTGIEGRSGDGGLAVNAEIAPRGLILDSARDLYITNGPDVDAPDNTHGSVVRKVTAATGIITTIAGTGVPGFSGDGGPAASAELNDPGAMAFDSADNLYIADAGNNRVREISAATGIITTVAGNGPSYPTPCSFSDGTITGSDVCPEAIAFDGAGNMFIADWSDGVIREMHPAPSPLILPTTPVGDINPPTVIPLDINADGTTITGISVPVSQGGKQEYNVTDTGCTLNIALSAGTVCDVSITFTAGYVGERPMPLQVNTSAGRFNFGMIGTGTGSEVALTPGAITTVAGNGTPGYSGDGGPAISAEMSPAGIAFDSAGNLYVAANSAIRKIAAGTGVISTVAGNGTAGYSGDGGPATSAELQSNFITVDSEGNLYIGDTGNNAIRKIAATTGIITTLAGNGAPGFGGDGGPATSAALNLPGNVAFDNADNLYFPDTANNRVREVQAKTGIITTLAGTGSQGYSGDGGPATSAELYQPVSIAIDSKNNLYISDSDNNVIRKVALSTGMITTVAGNGPGGYSGDGGPATSAKLHSPGPLALDSANNLYISDRNNNAIREVTADKGIITTVAGNGAQGFGGDNGSATASELNAPYGIALDGTGNIYFSDRNNNRIREVNVLESTLNYAITPVGTTSADSPQTATMTNIGNDILTFPGPFSSSDLVISNNSFSLDQDSSCVQLTPPPTKPNFNNLGSGDSCTFLISFTPTKRGVNTGTVTVTDDALNATSTQIVHLNELGPSTGSVGDFTLSVTPSSQPIRVGSTATYKIFLSGTDGFTGSVSLTATGLPPGATMNFNPATVTISGTARATSVLTIATAADQAKQTPSKGPLSGKGASLLYGALLFPLLGIARARKKLQSARLTMMLAVFGLMSLGAVANLTGCADIGLQADPMNYTITVQATSGNLQHSTNVVLALNTYSTVKYK